MAGLHRRRRTATVSAVLAVVVVAALAGVVASPAVAAPGDGASTAWRGGRWHLDPRSVVSRSDIVLAAANALPAQMMPLGSGTLGVATWNPPTGFTAQLNRVDTLPNWLSPGWLMLPGLSAMTTAPDFSARLDLYNGRLIQTGGGMTLTAYARSGTDQLVIDVTGADPDTPQIASLQLWESAARPVVTATADGTVATLSATWAGPGPAGVGESTFGLLSGITAGGRDVRVSSPTGDFPAGSAPGAAYGAQVDFRPHPDGSFRVVVVSPQWTGGDAQATATSLLGDAATAGAAALEREHTGWWHRFWHSIALMKLESADGAAQYLEKLRLIDLYAEAGANRDSMPGDSAGVSVLYRSRQDHNQYGPGAWWHWNNRMQIEANVGAGAFALNEAYFSLYRDNLANLRDYTQRMNPGLEGICIPETMLYNGAGNETSICSKTTGRAWYNARTISTGAEVGLRVWQQYLYTGDRAFLERNYPLMAESARFLLSYATVGAVDGNLHTFPSNAHETQWDVHDPTTDLAAMGALFPAVVAAATTLGRDADLAARLRQAQDQIPPYARVFDTANGDRAKPPPTATLCNPPTDTVPAAEQRAAAAACDNAGNTILWLSYDVEATLRNWENIGLEPVWPYGLIGDDTVSPEGGDLTALARRTYALRPNRPAVDCAGCTVIPASGQVKGWSTDPIAAARLGLAKEFETAAIWLTEGFSSSPSSLGGGSPAFYEQSGTVVAGMQEALVQHYDGLLRIAPAWPAGWNGAGTVFIQGAGKVHVQVHGGVVGTVAIEAGSTAPIRVRNPWPGQRVEVVDGRTGRRVVAPTTDATFTVPARARHSYLVQRVDTPVRAMPFQPLTGVAATAAATLDALPPLNSRVRTRHIGIPGPDQAVALAPAQITARAGARFSGAVAVASVPAMKSGVPLAVSIDWGDGRVTRGSAVPERAGTGALTATVRIEGEHRYRAAGTYPVTVTLSDAGTSARIALTSAEAVVAPR
ncbi:MAG TPA: hypothetical protein VK453_23745 [Micromonosporaceae bacterium]|nr:hypothetical protein [Micromonosporaceae bacterium]